MINWDLKKDDIVVIRAFDDIPEHLFQVWEIYEDCIVLVHTALFCFGNALSLTLPNDRSRLILLFQRMRLSPESDPPVLGQRVFFLLG